MSANDRSKAVPIVTALILGGALSGCFPYAISYVHLDGHGVSYRRSPCSDGAPVGVRYERSEARFEVTLEPHALSPLKDAYLKVRAPRHMAITIPNPTARIAFRGAAEGRSTTVRLEPAPLDWQGPYVEQMRRASPLAEHRFVFLDLPPIDSPGTLELPVVYVDGVAVESPVLTFERRHYAGMAPLNC